MRVPAATPQPGALTPAETPVTTVDLSVVIVNYNVREFLEQTLRSVQRAATGLRIEVFVVDNDSVDGSVEMVRQQFPDVYLIANSDNVGFGCANNQAIRKARGRYLLILNPDTLLEEDTLRTLVAFMDRHPEAGAVGCTILNPDGSFAPESRRAFPTPAVAFYRVAGMSRLFPRSRRFGRYNLSFLPEDEVAEVDALSGSCMLVRHDALYHSRNQAATGAGAGLFDEDFFMYGEDLDWCYRIKQAGWKVFYTPETRIIHYKGESTRKSELQYVRHFYGAMRQFSQKHLHGHYSRLFTGLLQAGILVGAVLHAAYTALRRLGPPVLDLILSFLVVLAVGWIRAEQADKVLSVLFLMGVAPAYALAVVSGIAMSRGYRLPTRAVRPVFVGALAGLVAVASLSFFVKDIAFSRAVVLASCPLIAAALLGLRWTWTARKRTPRRAVLVGPRSEAERLRAMLARHPAPSFELLGYVDRGSKRRIRTQPDTFHIGSLRQLRDVVRIRRVNDVIFATAGLTNQTIFGLIQQLNGLPLQFKMFAEGSRYVIGKASVENLALPALVDVTGRTGAFRSPSARRAFDLAGALMGFILYVPVAVLARLYPRTGYEALAGRLAAMPDVVLGRRSLVGYHEHEIPFIQGESGLRPGVFAVSESLARRQSDQRDVAHTYRFYAANQSASLDIDIIVQSVRNLMQAPDLQQ
ncbi:MAG TPA: glycosyltransferase [Rhodothermales bacterium]|nr:glycosyltransferase [Rhodothermales bacterium]